jgi:hypothetical protein
VKRIHFFHILFVAAALFSLWVIFGQREDEHSLIYQQYEQQIAEHMSKVDSLKQFAEAQKQVIDSLENQKPIIVEKWKTILKPVETFSFTETHSVLTQEINAACEQENKQKTTIYENDTLACFGSEQIKCILTQLYTGKMFAELYGNSEQQNEKLKSLVSSQDTIMGIYEEVLNLKDAQIDILHSEKKQERRKGLKRGVVIGASLASFIWLLVK